MPRTIHQPLTKKNKQKKQRLNEGGREAKVLNFPFPISAIVRENPISSIKVAITHTHTYIYKQIYTPLLHPPNLQQQLCEVKLRVKRGSYWWSEGQRSHAAENSWWRGSSTWLEAAMELMWPLPSIDKTVDYAHDSEVLRLSSHSPPLQTTCAQTHTLCSITHTCRHTLWERPPRSSFSASWTSVDPERIALLLYAV